MRTLLKLRNLVDDRAAILAGLLDRSGLARRQGRSTRELLIVMGCAPSFAMRLLRVAASLTEHPTLAAHAADGAVSGEHADAIVRGMAHIRSRSPEPPDDAARHDQVTDLLGQFFSGATPAEIAVRARAIGNERAQDSADGLPAAEDRSSNTVDLSRDDDGRVHLRADLDVEVGEKVCAAIEELSAPRPEPDGSADARCAGRRRADALEAILDIAARNRDSSASAPRTQVLVTIPADAPHNSTLAFGGPVTEGFARGMSCDAVVTPMLVDGETVPLDVGRDKRLFPAHLRRALYIRDQCCIKCGAPAGRTHAHHIAHWADGGETSLDNGCLLCPACHAAIHHDGWEVFIGADHHPWLVPPATVRRRREPLPAYNRRTLTTERISLAA